MTDTRQQAIKDVGQRFGISEYSLNRLCTETPDNLWVYMVNQTEARLKLEEALRKLVEKLDLVEPSISSAFMMSAIHGGHYTGPTYGKELGAARAALEAGKEK